MNQSCREGPILWDPPALRQVDGFTRRHQTVESKNPGFERDSNHRHIVLEAYPEEFPRAGRDQGSRFMSRSAAEETPTPRGRSEPFVLRFNHSMADDGSCMEWQAFIVFRGTGLAQEEIAQVQRPE